MKAIMSKIKPLSRVSCFDFLVNLITRLVLATDVYVHLSKCNIVYKYHYIADINFFFMQFLLTLLTFITFTCYTRMHHCIFEKEFKVKKFTVVSL